eukprot:14890153-Heterocapsa_arctica.AAC.1
MVDNGRNYGQVSGEIAYVVCISEALLAGETIHRTPLGSFVIIRGGCEAHHICAVMVYEPMGNYPSGSVAVTDFMKLCADTG